MRKNIILLIILSISLVSTPGLGAKESCIFSKGRTVKDYSIDPKEFPGVISDKDISRNQDTSGWCQSFAAADLLCYHISKQSSVKLKDQCSAADLRLNYGPTDSTVNGDNRQETSFKILQNYNRRGICPESVFPSEYWNNNEILTKELFEKLESNDKKTRTEAGVSLYELCPECMAKTAGDSVKSIVEKLNKDNVNKVDFLKKLNAKMCDGKRIGDGINYKLLYGGLKDDISYVLKSQLIQKTPVIIQLNKLDKINPNFDVKNQSHAVVVIGMDLRDNGNGVEDCYYTVKNSWGAGCDFVKENPSVRCDAKTGLLYISSELMYTPGFADNPVWIQTDGK